MEPQLEQVFEEGVEPIYQNKVCSVIDGFVVQLPPYLTKVAITDGLSQTVVLEHASDMQVLNRYQGVIFAEGGCELMGCILAKIGNVGMQACDGLTVSLRVSSSLSYAVISATRDGCTEYLGSSGNESMLMQAQTS